MDENTILDCINQVEYVKSLDYELNDDGKEMTLYDSIKYDEKLIDEDTLDLKRELNKLDSNERKIIELRYFQDKSQQDVSNELGISQVQVSRNEKKILMKLKNRLTV